MQLKFSTPHQSPTTRSVPALAAGFRFRVASTHAWSMQTIIPIVFVVHLYRPAPLESTPGFAVQIAFVAFFSLFSVVCLTSPLPFIHRSLESCTQLTAQLLPYLRTTNLHPYLHNYSSTTYHSAAPRAAASSTAAARVSYSSPVNSFDGAETANHPFGCTI